MSRPSVLFVESDAELRKQISTGLARYGYEVVPAVDVEEGVRFARGLDVPVLVADMDVPGFAGDEVLDRLPELRSGNGGILVLLGRSPEEEAHLPKAVRYLPVDGLAGDEMVRRLRLVLLGQEIGVETDPALESLVGELEQTPPLELVRALHRAELTGQVELPAGELRFDRGAVVAATARPLGTSYRPVGGLKAFCRLGRLRQGTFWVRPLDRVPTPVAAEAVDGRVDDLVIRAVEDASAGELPHPRSTFQVELGPAFFSSTFTPAQQRVLEIVQRGARLGRLLDELPETDGTLLAHLARLRDAGVLTLQEPEARLFVVTDSSCDLPRALAREHGIQVVPLSVRFGDQRYQDGVDLEPKAFYDMLESNAEHPKTAPPDVDAFAERYRELLPRRDVVSVHISEKMSQTVVHARHAAAGARKATFRRDEGDAPPELEVVDTRSVSLGLGLMALFAARMAARDLTAGEVTRRLQEIRERIGILFVVDTLEYLKRGGRIGAAQAWMGKLLGIKPILGVADGEVVPVDRVRGGRAAHPRILELVAERTQAERPLLAAVAHAKAPVWADRLRQLLTERFDVAELVVAEMGPTVGAHAGPGTVGIAWMQPTDEELALLAPTDDDTVH